MHDVIIIDRMEIILHNFDGNDKDKKTDRDDPTYLINQSLDKSVIKGLPLNPPIFETGYEFKMDQLCPFIMSILSPFAKHLNTSLNPNHLQFLIISGLGEYLAKSGKAEQLRGKLGIVHEGKMEITIRNDALVKE